MASSPELARLLRRANRSVERQMMRAVAAAGLDMLQAQHLTVLRVLDADSDGTRITELARDADVSRQAVQQIVAQLARLGIVETLTDPRDARARLVRYTPRGRAGYLRCMDAFAEIERDYQKRLGNSRMSQLKNALRTLAEAGNDPRD
jgi:DNA-binding MarR family transcriptional regulator